MHPHTRRQFLDRAISGAAAITLARPLAALARDSKLPCPASAWRKQGIVLEPTEPWEGNDVQNFTSPAEPLDNGRWRIWYSASDRRAGFTLAYAEGVPGEKMTKHPARCSPGDPANATTFSIGHLPDAWKPVQVTHIELLNSRHRIYFWAHGPGILRYLAAESDDGHRYRVLDPLRPVLYHPNDRAASGVPSPDGVMFSKSPTSRPADEPPAESRLISNDATTIYQLPDGTFEMYSVALVPVPKEDPAYMPHDNAPGLLRVIDRYTSADGLRFETRKRVIQRDARDPVDQQFYYLAVTRTPKGCVGMLGHYRCQAQTMDLEWCFSSDGIAWNRPLRGAWLRRGDPPDPDCLGIYSGRSLVFHQDRWHLFYTGVNSSHNGKESHGKPRQVIMLATTEDIWS